MGRAKGLFSLCKKKTLVWTNNALNLPQFFKNRGIINDIYVDSSISLSDSYLQNEQYRGNCLYGIGRELRIYGDCPTTLSSTIEHEVYFGEHVSPEEIIESGLPAVLTFGAQRKKHLRKVSDKAVFTIGPYITYAQPFYDFATLNQIRVSNQKTLLFFPTHPADYQDTNFQVTYYQGADYPSRKKNDDNFNYDELFTQLVYFSLKHECRKIIVCLYYQDILDGKASWYSKQGFEVVCAGHKNDPLFLPRLRTIIELSDITASDSVGTHVGYCVALGKPHTIFPQKVEYQPEEMTSFPDTATSINSEEKSEVASVFAEESEEISDMQIEIGDKYWGFDSVKTKEEMQIIFSLCDWTRKNSFADDNSYRSALEHRYFHTNNEQEKDLLEDALT